jgi:hypothetical protein
MTSSCTDEINERIKDTNAFAQWHTSTDTNINSATSNIELDSILPSITETNTCLQEKINAVGGTSTSIAQMQTDIINIEDQLKLKKEAIHISKERLSYLTDPSHNVSYYQSWFPLFRPLKPQTIPILIGIATFFTAAAVCYLLYSIIGLAAIFMFLTRLFNQLTPAFWLLLAISIGVIVYLAKRKP